MAEHRPFHESIVDVLNECITGSGYELEIILALLRSTKIPKNHDAIIAAWKSFITREYGPYESYCDSDGVHRIVDDIEAQKQEAEAEEQREEALLERELFRSARGT